MINSAQLEKLQNQTGTAWIASGAALNLAQAVYRQAIEDAADICKSAINQRGDFCEYYSDESMGRRAGAAICEEEIRKLAEVNDDPTQS